MPGQRDGPGPGAARGYQRPSPALHARRTSGRTGHPAALPPPPQDHRLTAPRPPPNRSPEAPRTPRSTTPPAARTPAGPACVVVHRGTARPTFPGSTRTWRVTAYGPSAKFPRGRVAFKDPLTGEWDQRAPRRDGGPNLDELWAQIEEAINDAEQNRPSTLLTGQHAIDELLPRWEAFLRSLGRDSDYIRGRAGTLRLWFLADFGRRPLEQWGPELTAQILRRAREGMPATSDRKARAGLAPKTVENLGVAMAALRDTAHRPDENGKQWMPDTWNPLKGVTFSAGRRRGRRLKIGSDYISADDRPSTAAVHGLAAVARLRAAKGKARGWEPGPQGLAELFEMGGFGGLRVNELLGIRAVDLVDDVTLHVQGVWLDPNGERPHWRPWLKTGSPMEPDDRFVPYYSSLMTSTAALIPAAHERVLYRAALIEQWRDKARKARRAADRDQLLTRAEWLEGQNQPYLFCDDSRVERLPWTQEALNRHFHGVTRQQRALAVAEPERFTPWPEHVDMRMLRHHCAVWWNQQGHDWPIVAEFLGHSLEICLTHYVRPATADRDAAFREARER
jgi:hypothetical protein